MLLIASEQFHSDLFVHFASSFFLSALCSLNSFNYVLNFKHVTSNSCTQMPDTYFKLLVSLSMGANVLILLTIYSICLLQWATPGFRDVGFCPIVLSALLEPLHGLFSSLETANKPTVSSIGSKSHSESVLISRDILVQPN